MQPCNSPSGWDKQDFAPSWAAIAEVQKLLCTLPWRGKIGTPVPLRISFMLMV